MEERILDSPALDKVLEVVAPEDVGRRFVFEFRNRLPDNIGEEVDQPSTGLVDGAVSWEGEPVLGNLEQRDTRRPDV